MDPIPYADADRWVSEAEPADRMRRICALHPGKETLPHHRHVALHDWWPLAGAHWNACTSVTEHVAQLRAMLARRRPAVLMSMMTSAEQKTLQAFTRDPVDVYRGCGSESAPGICWTLSRDDARAYALRPAVIGPPVTVTGRVWIIDIVAVKLAGKETHVISFNVAQRGTPKEAQA